MSEIVQEILKRRVNNKEHFKSDEVIVKGHPLGYMSEEDIDITNMPKEAVSGVKNMDFMPGYDKVREPYDLYLDLTSQLPAGYEIVRFCEKSFVDGTGNVRRAVIYAAKKYVNGLPDPSTPLRIYVNSYYLPASSYDNCWVYETHDSEWRSEYVELTARYKYGDIGIQFTIGSYNPSEGGGPYQLRVIPNGTTEGIFAKDRNYFRGWYVIYDNDVIGIVTASIATYSGSTYTGTYFKVMLEDGISMTDNSKVGLCRFPVNEYNASAPLSTGGWNDITDVRFEADFPNAVKIWCGHESRPLNLSFITERQYFGGVFTRIPGYNPTSHSGWLTPQGVPNFSTAKTFKIRCKERYGTQFYVAIKFAWSVDSGSGYGSETDMPLITIAGLGGDFDALQDVTLGISVRLKGNYWDFLTTHYATFEFKPGDSASWNGFWFGYDMPEVKNKKWYKYKDGNIDKLKKDDLGKELGISYDINTIPIETGTKTEKIYSFAVELDGYQTIFVKHVFLPKYPSAPTPYHDYLEAYIYFSPAFDRRITGHLLYFEEEADFKLATQDSSDYELPEVSRFNDMKRGYFAISKMGAKDNPAGDNWKVLLIDSTEDALEGSATGEKLSIDRLNNPYWYSVIQKAKYAMRVGDNSIAVNLANDTANADKETQQPNSEGSQAICVSQLQQGANTASVMSTKRIRQITSGFPLLAGAWIAENQFMLFTEKESFYYDITEEETLATRRIAVYDGRGLVSADAMISAREMLASQAGPLTAPLSSLFRGIYFAGEYAIYEFKENRVKPITYEEDENGRMILNRWRTEYEELTQKSLIRAGYRSSTQDVYFSIPELGQIRVWNRGGHHWKIYEFPDTVKYFVQEQDGELFFHTANKIYKTEAVGTSVIKDKGTEKIEWNFSQYLNHGNSQLMKILDGFEFTYELEGTSTTKVHLKVEAADDRVALGLTTVFDEDITVRSASEAGKFYEKRGYPNRDRGQWYKFTMSSTADTESGTFRLLMLKLNALFMRGSLTRE